MKIKNTYLIFAFAFLVYGFSFFNFQQEKFPSIIAYWSFNNIEKGLVPDVTSNLHGHIQGKPGLAKGVIENCLEFDGINDYIEIKDSFLFDFSNAKFSISIWANPYALNVGKQIIVAKNNDLANQFDWVLKINSDNRFHFSMYNDGWHSIGSQTIPNPGKWYHLAVTVNYGFTRIYVNGVLEGEAMLSNKIPNTAGPITFGGSDHGGILTDMFYGALDEITLSKEVFSENNIVSLFEKAAKSKPIYEPILPAGWDPVNAGNEVMARLITVTAPHIKGAHDAEMLLMDNHAYIVSTVNELRSGHSSSTAEYTAMSIVNLDKMEMVEASIPIARSEQTFENASLPTGQTWVPRIIRKSNNVIRVFFVSQKHHVHGQIWYRDFTIDSHTFENKIFRAQLKTSLGTFDMQPVHFHADAVEHGFNRDLVPHGLYLFDSFKNFNGDTYIAINNFPGRQNALARINDSFDTFEIIGHINEPPDLAMSEAAVNRLPDGTWIAILRTQAGPRARNYAFSESRDGREWSPAEYRGFVRSGTESKPTFDKFNNGIYYLGWQDSTRIDGVRRSVFNLDISRDGRIWERKYRFESADRFEYPTFREYNGKVWLTISGNQQANIKFGMLEKLY